MRFALPIALAGALSLGACSGMNTTEQRTLSGTAIGAAAGTVITAATGGCIICGAAIGAGAGALGGFLYDRANPRYR
ncbi:MAG: hypothetical protein KIT16_13995 [Rhodospirillaceae bacterium]|nr:hypothetical protein [Rhodospirillaceae bacterium]